MMLRSLLFSASHSPSSHHLTLLRPCSSNITKLTAALKARHCTSRASITDHGQPVPEQRKTNLYPDLWDYNYMQSLTSGYEGDEYKEELENMKEEVKGLIRANQEDLLTKLELIDVVQRLGLQYHFEAEIQLALDKIHKWPEGPLFSNDLYATALRFRLLRQQGYNVSQDVFRSFVDKSGNFRAVLMEDVQGLLSLYEASFHGLKGETIIDKAMEFSYACLKDMEKNKLPKGLAMRLDHALDMPMHWRPGRLVARWFMRVYEEEPDMNPALLKLAKLDFNVVQSVHMKDFDKLARWWSELGLGTTLTFSRDNLIEHYLWNITMLFEPQYKAFRELTTKVTSMITLIDDVYDKLGSSLEELELLTHLIDRWDISRVGELPPEMRTCFQALHSITNEIGHQVLIERGIDVNKHLQKAWADQCKAYLVEAKWCHNGLKPTTMEDYLSNAVRSVGGFIVLLCCFFITTDGLTEEEIEYVSRIPSIMQSSALIIRLNNDLVPSSTKLAQGDQLNSVRCFMNQTGASEREAREHVENLVHETWKAMNGDLLNDKYRLAARPFVKACQNLARASHWIYRYGDGHEARSQESKAHMISILVRPVPIG